MDVFGDETSIFLRCKRVSGDDIGRSFIRLPKSVMKRYNISPFDYVVLTGPRSRLYVRVLPSGDNQAIFRVSSHILNRLGLRYNDLCCINVIKNIRRKLIVAPAERKDVGFDIVRIHKSVLEEMGLRNGDIVELLNPNVKYEETCHLMLKVETHYRESSEELMIDSRLRQLLNINLGDTICILRPPYKWSKKSLFERFLERFEKFLEWLVGVKKINLIVLKGEDIDEGRGIARITDDTASILGIKAGDFLKVRWCNNAISVRALIINQNSEYVKNYLSKLSLIIQLCATERERLGVDVYDIVQVYRDPIKKLILSFDRVLTAILSALGLFAILVAELGIGISVSLLISLVIGFMLLYVLFVKIRAEV